MNTLLSTTELREITGWHARHKLIAWLKNAQIPYTLKANGYPLVLRESIEKVIDPSLFIQPNPPQHKQINFKALEGAHHGTPA